MVLSTHDIFVNNLKVCTVNTESSFLGHAILIVYGLEIVTGYQ